MPDLEEDEETDERAPLVAARPEPAPPAWREIRAMLWLLRWVLLLALLNTCLMRTGSVAYFPYLRTLQYCDTPANPAATHTSDWSGSDHCGDLKLVTREAQAIVGLGRGVGLVAHCVSMPFLGRLGDTVGRRILLIIHFVGMLLESMINAANPSVPVFVLGCALRGALSSLWPALMSMIADLCRPEQRILAYGLVALATAVVGAVCFVAVTKHVLERHHSDYRPFWGVLTIFSLCGCLLACACPETLPPGPTVASEGKEPRVTRRSRLCMCARLFASCHALPGRADSGLGVTACGTVLANPVTLCTAHALHTHCTRTAHALHTHCTRTACAQHTHSTRTAHTLHTHCTCTAEALQRHCRGAAEGLRDLPLLGVRQHGVGFGDGLELGLRLLLLVRLVLVRVPLQAQLAERLLDLAIGRAALHAEDPVVVGTRRRGGWPLRPPVGSRALRVRADDE